MTPEYQIFKKHGITADLNCLLMRTQELAMAVNLQGVHQATTHYNSTILSHGGHEIYVMTKPIGALWEDASTHLNVYLPSSASSDEERQQSRRQLGEAVNYLTTLLEEGQPS